MKSNVSHAMKAIVQGMGHAARAAKARRFAKRAAPAQVDAESTETGAIGTNRAPSPVHDALSMGMTPEEMDELGRTE